MQKGLDIIYFTLFPWDNAYSSVSLSFTREFIKHNRVFYINHPYSLKDFFTSWHKPMVKARRMDLLLNRMRYETIPEMPEVIAVHPPLTLPVNWMPAGTMYEKLHRVNQRIILNTISKVIRDYNITDYIYLNCFNPFYAGVLPHSFKPLLNIYSCIDDMWEEGYTARHGARLEEQVMAQADVVFVTSGNLYRMKKHLNPNTHILHNAVDLSIFRRALEETIEKPEELKGITGKIIGFTGNLDGNRLDYRLIHQVAERHRDKTLVLVGPVNSEEVGTYGLDRMQNVILTGGKHITELPGYLQYFDVAIIPFQKNKLTASIYPLKINEYLAAGKPVVATNFSDDIRTFAEEAYIASNEEMFLDLIDRAITENDAEKIRKRVAKAATNTWTDRVREFWDVIGPYLPEGKGNSLRIPSKEVVGS